MSMQGGTSGMESMSNQMKSATDVTTYLKGINFPADKQKIVDMVKSKGAPESVVQWLNKLPDRQYTNPTEVAQEFGKLK
jgi:hypothetical protein